MYRDDLHSRQQQHDLLATSFAENNNFNFVHNNRPFRLIKPVFFLCTSMKLNSGQTGGKHRGFFQVIEGKRFCNRVATQLPTAVSSPMFTFEQLRLMMSNLVRGFTSTRIIFRGHCSKTERFVRMIFSKYNEPCSAFFLAVLLSKKSESVDILPAQNNKCYYLV